MFKEDLTTFENFPREVIHRRHFMEDLDKFLSQTGLDDFLSNFKDIPLSRDEQIVEIFDDNGKTNAIRVAGKKASKLFNEGHASVRFRCMDHHNSSLNKMRTSLEGKMPFKITRSYVNGFLSKAGTQGTEHFDGHEVLVMQIKGFKKWTLSWPKGLQNPNIGWGKEGSLEGLRPFGIGNENFFNERVGVAEIVLGPGDVLFMPRGLFHLTETIQDSFHITMSIEAQTKAEAIAEQIQNILLSDSDLRGVQNRNEEVDLKKVLSLVNENLSNENIPFFESEDLLKKKRLSLLWNDAFSIKNSKLLGPDRYSVTFFKGNRFFEEVMVDEKELTLINYLKDRKSSFEVDSILSVFNKMRPQKVHRIISYLVENLTLNTAMI